MLHDPLFLIAANLFVAVLLRMLKPNLLSAAFLAVVMIGSGGYLAARFGSEIVNNLHRGSELALTFAGHPPAWPPQRLQPYPDLELVDQEGKRTKLSQFKGKVILVELVGMSCSGCVAFAGGHQRGDFQGVAPQADLESIEEYARQYGRIRLDDERIVFVQLLLFNPQLQAPAADQVQQWARHFGLDRAHSQVVLAGTPAMATSASRALIPGFHLIDQNFVLRADSSGHDPADDLYRDLLPMIRKLLKESTVQS